MKRRQFLKATGVIPTGLWLNNKAVAAPPPIEQRLGGYTDRFTITEEIEEGVCRVRGNLTFYLQEENEGFRTLVEDGYMSGETIRIQHNQHDIRARITSISVAAEGWDTPIYVDVGFIQVPEAIYDGSPA
jgi:hypothetical protein